MHRNLFLDHDKTWKRKWNEALYTISLEMNYSKKEILEGYLNTIYYGHGAYGVEAASHYYFGKNAKDLTLAEASMLAGIPKGPSSYSPIVNLKKQKHVKKLFCNPWLTNTIFLKLTWKKQCNTLVFQRVNILLQHNKIAPYFQDAVKQVLKTQLQIDERTIELGGLRVYTTLNENQQALAEDAFAKIIEKSSEFKQL